MFRDVLFLAVFFFFAFVVSASAQNYGGITGFNTKFPIQTYQEPTPGERLKPAGKKLLRKDIGPIDQVLILAVIGVRGNGYVQIETTSGDFWLRRGHVKPRKKALVDKKIAESNGEITCPPGQRKVAGRDRTTTAATGRSLGGVSVYCK